MLIAALVGTLLTAPPDQLAFNIESGDRIVWLGSTFVEREQRFGHWETALHLAFPEAVFRFRNLGWSGDTVFGEARGRFDFHNSEKCFRQIVDQTLALQPTIIIISYGSNESFEGRAGVPRFEKGLEKLLDALEPAKARRTVLMSPLPYEIGYPLPHIERRNQELALYAATIGRIAQKRGLLFADLFTEVHTLYSREQAQYDSAKPGPDTWYTENGWHLRDSGYARTSSCFLKSLGLPVARHPSNAAKLRSAIVAKNELFFHRWRPQNETYLFGFRKHEQGQNAKEVAAFDPLIAAAEEKITKLMKELTK
ncbi:MAG: SGNH/GDSL hydrolase family protein [Gemmataceae bacterium]|nr:SGNH/GDSL hydrolase family protein [Gemmata sp.]MDW8198055.1 SGNH/GDSL hydrolase family protein [Gemmataceae bacterium]